MTGSKKVRTKIEPSADIDNCAAPTDFGNHLVGNVLIFFFFFNICINARAHQGGVTGTWRGRGMAEGVT